MQKRLYKSRTEKKLAGVCGGLARYLGVDPTVVRVIWFVLSCVTLLPVIAYIGCAFIIPEEPEYIDSQSL